MSILTTFFNLIKPAKTDPAAIAQLNSNFDTIDTEMHKPPLTVNDIQPDPTTRNIQITTVPLADNLTSDETQINQGTYIIRSSGGEAPIQNGAAWLSNIIGNMTKTGEIQESITPSVTIGDDHLSIVVDRDTFVEYVQSSGTITLNYTSAWSANPELYGITVTGTPVNGDQIQVVYVKANRGTIKIATPTTFISTGWNLYNHAVGYARVSNYSEEYGFMIGGTYTSIAFSETLNGEQTPILPVNGAFNVPSDGYVFVTGGNGTDTMIWMTWSDWGEEPNGGTFAAYSQTSVDISGVMVNFPYGLMKIGNVYDEIDLNTQNAYSRIERLAYTDANLEEVITSGVAYDVDENYIYAVKTFPTTYTISLNGEYTVNDHGTEMFLATTVPVTASSLYGNDLKNKLRTDVLTISQQSLSVNQQKQILNNIGGVGFVAQSLTTNQKKQAAQNINAVQYGTILQELTSNGIGYRFYRFGNMVQVTAHSGKTTNAVAADANLLTVPDGFHAATNIYWYNGEALFFTNTGGTQFYCRSAIDANKSIRFGVVYFTNDAMPT